MGAYRNHPGECDLCVFDSETGSVDPKTGALLEIAAIRTRAGGEEVVKRLSLRVLPEPGDIIQPEAAAINGYTYGLWQATAVPLREAMKQLCIIGTDTILVGHNLATFDWYFLLRAFKRLHIARWPGPRWRVDTMQMAWPLLATGAVPDLKLGTLTQHFGWEQAAAHTAASDAEDARRLYIELSRIWGRGLGAHTAPVEEVA